MVVFLSYGCCYATHSALLDAKVFVIYVAKVFVILVAMVFIVMPHIQHYWLPALQCAAQVVHLYLLCQQPSFSEYQRRHHLHLGELLRDSLHLLKYMM